MPLLTEKQKEEIAARYGMTAAELQEKQYRAAYKQTGVAYPYKCSECENKIAFNPQGKWKHTCSEKCRKRRARKQKKVLDNQ